MTMITTVSSSKFFQVKICKLYWLCNKYSFNSKQWPLGRLIRFMRVSCTILNYCPDFFLKFLAVNKNCGSMGVSNGEQRRARIAWQWKQQDAISASPPPSEDPTCSSDPFIVRSLALAPFHSPRSRPTTQSIARLRFCFARQAIVYSG